MPAIAGLRGSGDWGTDERPKNFRDMILRLRPNGTAPITALMEKMGKQSTNDPEFAWWEELLTIVSLQLNDADDMAAGDTTVVVDNGALALSPGDILMVEDGFGTGYGNELVKVTAVTSDTEFTVSRGYAGSSAGTITDDSYFVRVGTAFAEGTSAPDSTSLNPTKLYNYCEIFKKTYNVTNTAAATYARTGDVVKNDKLRQAFQHSTDLEMAALFGKRNETTGSNGEPERTTGGMVEFLATAGRVSVKSGAYTSMNAFFDDVHDVFDYTGDGDTGGDERIIFAGSGALVAMNKLAAASGDVTFGEVVKAYGMNFVRFVTPHGTLYFKSHPLLSRMNYHTNSMIVVDPPGVRYRYLRDTKSSDNIQAPDADQKLGQWLTEAGFEFNHLETMKLITNVSFSST